MRWDLGKGRKQSSGDTNDIINWLGFVLPEFRTLIPQQQKKYLSQELIFYPNTYLALNAKKVVVNPFIDSAIPLKNDDEEETPIRYCYTCRQVRLTPDDGICSKCNSMDGGVNFVNYEKGQSATLDEYFNQRIFFWRKAIFLSLGFK